MRFILRTVRGGEVDSINGKCALFKLINGFNLAHMKARAVRTVIKLMLQYFTVCSYIPSTVKKDMEIQKEWDAKPYNENFDAMLRFSKEYVCLIKD